MHASLAINGCVCVQEVTHVFLDEVHERSVDTDFLLIALQDVLIR